MVISLRDETPDDLPAIRDVIRLAFGRDDEARVVDALRDGGYVRLFSRGRRSWRWGWCPVSWRTSRSRCDIRRRSGWSEPHRRWGATSTLEHSGVAAIETRRQVVCRRITASDASR